MTEAGTTHTGALLVVSAHAGDFVWRSGGAIALAAERGQRAKVVCLSYGERGESAKAWLAGKTLPEIKAIRQAEAEAAAEALGAEIEFLDAGDYPLLESHELVHRLVDRWGEHVHADKGQVALRLLRLLFQPDHAPGLVQLRDTELTRIRHLGQHDLRVRPRGPEGLGELPDAADDEVVSQVHHENVVAEEIPGHQDGVR